MNLWGRGRVLGHSLVAVLADDEPAVLLATLIHNLGVLLIGNLRRRGRRRGAVRGSARGGKYLKFPMRSERLREAGNWGSRSRARRIARLVNRSRSQSPRSDRRGGRVLERDERGARAYHVVDSLGAVVLLDVIQAPFAALVLELLELRRRQLSLGGLGCSSAARAFHGGVRRSSSG